MMLVLSRMTHENVIVRPPGCDPIIVRVVEIRGDRVRLGFIARPDVTVNREEIDTRKQQEAKVE